MTETRITLAGDTVSVEHLALTDAALAAFVRETADAERPQLASALSVSAC